MLTQSQLLEVFDYRNGQLLWKRSTGRVSAYSEAGAIGKRGYRHVRFMGKSYLAHRLIYLMIKNELPIQIDHIDGNKLNNRIENLRSSTQSENRMNAVRSTLNKSGVKGVCWSRSNRCWHVQVKKGKKNVYSGFFADLEFAELVSVEARNKHHGTFARHDGK